MQITTIHKEPYSLMIRSQISTKASNGLGQSIHDMSAIRELSGHALHSVSLTTSKLDGNQAVFSRVLHEESILPPPPPATTGKLPNVVLGKTAIRLPYNPPQAERRKIFYSNILLSFTEVFSAKDQLIHTFFNVDVNQMCSVPR